MQKIRLLSWNVRGMNSPQKCKKVFHYLNKQKFDIVSLQETYIKKKDIRLLKNTKLGNEFITASTQRKKGVVIYVNNRFKARTIFTDNEGRYIGIEVNFLEGKQLIVGIYAPLDRKEAFFKKLNQELRNYNFDKVLIMGDWNGVINPELDRKSDVKIKKTQGILPQAFEKLIEENALLGAWRFKYKEARDYTYFLERHKSLSRIDFFMASKTLCKDIISIDSHPRTISDHNPIEMTIKLKSIEFSWKLNTSLLSKEEILKKVKETLRYFFKENIKEDIDITTVWEASKAVIRGFFIQQNLIMKKKKRERLNLLYQKLQQKEKELYNQTTNKIFKKEIKTFKNQIELEENKEIQNKLRYMRQTFFDKANKPGRWLAYRLRKHKERNIITEIKTKEGRLTMKQTEIKQEFKTFYTELYKKHQISKEKTDQFLDKAGLLKFNDEQRDILNNSISVGEVIEAIKKGKKGKSPGPDGLPIEYYQEFQD